MFPFLDYSRYLDEQAAGYSESSDRDLSSTD
jgi:hypothetical protein